MEIIDYILASYGITLATIFFLMVLVIQIALVIYLTKLSNKTLYTVGKPKKRTKSK